jgi:hypothetical protein
VAFLPGLRANILVELHSTYRCVQILFSSPIIGSLNIGRVPDV